MRDYVPKFDTSTIKKIQTQKNKRYIKLIKSVQEKAEFLVKLNVSEEWPVEDILE
jgi:hypothetical protein